MYPPETDVERIEWLLGPKPWVGLVADERDPDPTIEDVPDSGDEDEGLPDVKSDPVEEP